MKQIFARAAEERDIKQFVEWSDQNPNFDKLVLGFKTTFSLCAYDENGVMAFLPVQQPFCMEAMSFKPESSDSQKSLAMKELTHLLIAMCHQKGAGEIIFLGTNQSTNMFATRQGFAELPWKTYRVRLSDLEKPHDVE